MIKLVESYKEGHTKVGDYINYQPDYREYVLTKEDTGWEQSQVVCTESKLKYQFAGIIQGKLMIVADTVSDRDIILYGVTGHKNGADALQRCIQKCYSSKKLNAKGFCMTKEVFIELTEEIRDSIDIRYWLSSPYVNGIYTAYGGFVDGDCFFYGREQKYKYGNAYSVRPAVILPADIRIDKNNNLVFDQNDENEEQIIKGFELEQCNVSVSKDLCTNMMRLVDAYKQGRIKDGDYIDYYPDYQCCVLTFRETGVQKNQVLYTENNLKYQVGGLINGQLMLVADETTKSKITLQGRTGYRKGHGALQKYMKECFSSKELHAKGICLTESKRKLANNISDCKGKKYFLGQPVFNAEVGVFAILRMINDDFGYDGLFRDQKYPIVKELSYEVRPAVILPADILIDENNKLVLEKSKLNEQEGTISASKDSISSARDDVQHETTQLYDEEIINMSLREAYEQGYIKCGDDINYQPDYQELILTKEETGWSQQQVLCTKKSLKYKFAGVFEGKYIAVSNIGGVGNDVKIMLKGEIGDKKGFEALQKYVKQCYSSKNLHAEGVCLTQKTFFYKELPCEYTGDNLHPLKLAFGERYELKSNHIIDFGVEFFIGTRVGGRFFNEENFRRYTYGFRVAVILHPDIRLGDLLQKKSELEECENSEMKDVERDSEDSTNKGRNFIGREDIELIELLEKL